MNIKLRPLLDYGLDNTVSLQNAGFADYFVSIQMTLPTFLNMVRVESIDLASSRVILADGDQAVGVALIARRGWTSRLAAMSLIPAARGQGVGRAAMDLLLAEAAGRGDRQMVLEVIESNAPAVRLYTVCGFRVDRRLVGYEGTFPESSPKPEPEEVDIRYVAQLITTCGWSNLPWQHAGETLAQLSPPSKAYRLGEAYAVLSDPGAAQITIRSLIVRPEVRRKGAATRLLAAIIAKYPHKQWHVPVLCPEELGGVFANFGFSPHRLSQLQMSREIN